MLKLAKTLPEVYLPLVRFDYAEDSYEITQPINVYREFKKKTLVIGIPGAFVPSVQWKFLPEYRRHYNEVRALCGVERVMVVSVNDPHVMKCFAEEIDAQERFVYVCDYQAEVVRAMGCDVILPTLGLRGRPFRCVVDKGEVTHLLCEEDWKPTSLTRVYRLMRDFSPYLPYPYSVYPD